MRIREAQAPTSFNEATREIDIVVSTETPVPFGTRTDEVLLHDASAIDFSRFIGAPFLNAHKTGDVRDVLGVVTRYRLEGGKLIATVKLSRRADAEPIVNDIRDGIQRNVSVGFDVLKFVDRVDPTTGRRVRTVTRWRPREVSLTPFAADQNAHVRAQTRSNRVKTTKTPDVDDDVIDDNAPEPTEAEQRMQTRADIRDIAKRAGLPTSWADEQIDADRTPEQVRADAFDAMQARTRNAPRVRVLSPGRSPEETLHIRSAGFAARYLGVALPKDIEAQAREFANMDAADHARDILESNGIRTRSMGRERLLTTAMQFRSGMHTPADFPLMMDAGFSTAVRAAYEAAASPAVALLTIARTATNFKPQFLHQLGEFSTLAKVRDTEEIPHISRGEARETWALDTYAGRFAASRALILGDEFNQLGDFARDAGQAAAATVANLVVTQFTLNNGAGPLFSDGAALFHANHANFDPVASGIDVESVADARKHMLLQTGQSGEHIINVKPDTILVAPSNLMEAERIVAAVTPNSVGSVNPFAQRLNAVVEPRLESVDPWRWYLSDSKLPPLVLGGMAGAGNSPQVAAREGWEILGREWRVFIDVGVGPYDWRGVFRHEGAAVDSNTGA